MKFIEILSDAWNYIKEKKDHPVLFPLITLWLLTHWNIFYAFSTSNYTFEKMVDYINLQIISKSSNFIFLKYCLIYFFLIPIIKNILIVYNDSLSFISSFINMKKYSFDLSSIHIKKKLYEEQKRLSEEKQIEKEQSIFKQIQTQYDESKIIRFISFYKISDSNYINSFKENIIEIKKLLYAISKPSLLHSLQMIRKAQNDLKISLENLTKEINTFPEDEIYDEYGNPSPVLVIKDADNFKTLIQDFENKFISYVESIKNLN